MLSDLIYRSNYIKKQVDRENEICTRTGAPFNFYLKAARRIFADLDLSNTDAALACLQWDFSRARLRLQKAKTDEAKNDAVLELTIVADAVRILLENVFFEGGKIADEEE